MATKIETARVSNPDSIFLEDNTIIPWDKATQEMKEHYLQENRPAQNDHRGPDKGNGKEQRKKQRRPRHHS